MANSLEKLLGLSPSERKIYRYVTQGSFSVAEIVRETDLPRMTVHYALERFLERGLVRRVKRNKHFYYSAVARDSLLLSLMTDSVLSEGVAMLPVDVGVGFSVHKGKRAIYDLYEKLSCESAKQRLYTIQTTASTRYIFSHFSTEDLDLIHKIMKEKEVILEDIVEEDFFAPVHQEFGREFPRAIETFIDRLTVTYAIPAGVLSFTCDLVIGRDVVLFIDWWKETAFEVRSNEVVAICRDLFENFKNQAKKVRFIELAKQCENSKNQK